MNKRSNATRLNVDQRCDVALDVFENQACKFFAGLRSCSALRHAFRFPFFYFAFEQLNILRDFLYNRQSPSIFAV
jgi:hypothetical protein